MSFIHHAIAKKIKEDKEKDRTVREWGETKRGNDFTRILGQLYKNAEYWFPKNLLKVV